MPSPRKNLPRVYVNSSAGTIPLYRVKGYYINGDNGYQDLFSLNTKEILYMREKFPVAPPNITFMISINWTLVNGSPN